MSDKHELTLEDFDRYDLWSWDEDADDGSFLPVTELPLCANGENDLGVLYIRTRCKSPDSREWDAIIGLLPEDLTVYWLHVFDAVTVLRGILAFRWTRLTGSPLPCCSALLMARFH